MLVSEAFGRSVELFRKVFDGDVKQLKRFRYDVKEQGDYWVAEPGIKNLFSMFVFAKEWKRNVVLQVPHALDESFLYSLAFSLFKQIGARAMFFNLSKRSKFDPAHLLECHFNAGTAACADLVDCVVSLHGCKGGKECIISSGSLIPSARSVMMYEEINKAKNSETYLFPYHIGELGGTTNMQGVLLRSLGYPEAFLHFELGLGLRAMFKQIEVERHLFGSAFMSGIDKKLDYNHRQLLPLYGQWTLPLGVKARRELGPEGILHVLGETDLSKPKRVATNLGVNPTEINHYLE